MDVPIINEHVGNRQSVRSNHLSPYPATFEKAGRSMSGLLCTDNSLGIER